MTADGRPASARTRGGPKPAEFGAAALAAVPTAAPWRGSEAAPQADRRLISEAARLQEVGKIYVPSALLERPASELDRRERKQLAEHFEHGCRLALGAGIPPRACSWILHARERWDGSGPERLEGDGIPLGARILAVCREYLDAPTGGDETDPARAHDAANQHLRSLSGDALDPALVARAVGQGANGGDR